MGAGSKMSRRSLKSFVAATAIAGLHCGGKTTVFLRTSPGEATAGAGGTITVATSDSGAIDGTINCPIGGCLAPGCGAGAPPSGSGEGDEPAGQGPLSNDIVYKPTAGLPPRPDPARCGRDDG